VIETIRRLFEYDNWAIERELAALENVQNPEALRMLGHILAAKKIWLVRLNGRDSSVIETFPAVSWDDCRNEADEMAKGYMQLLDKLSANSLESTITYKNTKGDEFTTPVKEVLEHVLFHSAYHRGQIALLLRQGGDAAVNTDFITFTRL
jgi:uncharacterized damage-inducible protein DinB